MPVMAKTGDRIIVGQERTGTFDSRSLANRRGVTQKWVFKRLQEMTSEICVTELWRIFHSRIWYGNCPTRTVDEAK